LKQSIESLLQQSLQLPILLNIPLKYNKWDYEGVPSYLTEIPNIIIFHPSRDFGPATKLLGALEYLRCIPGIEHIITVDDDIIYQNRDHLSYLYRFGKNVRNTAFTINGVKLEHAPYRYKNGLKYNCQFSYVQIHAGFKSVCYPVRKLMQNNSAFALTEQMPAHIFNDDDHYFGIILKRNNIPLISVPHDPVLKITSIDLNSAVQEQVTGDRAENDSRAINHSVQNGYLTVYNRSFLPVIVYVKLFCAYLYFLINHYKRSLLLELK
jgi:hypothetical protein